MPTTAVTPSTTTPLTRAARRTSSSATAASLAGCASNPWGMPPAMDLLTAGHCCGTRNGAMASTLAGRHGHVCSIAQFECELTPGCPQVSTGYVDDSAACLAANPGDGHKSYGNYPTLLNAPLSGAHQCVAPVPYCTPNVQATWSAYRCARRGPQPPLSPLACLRWWRWQLGHSRSLTQPWLLHARLSEWWQS